MVVAKKKKILLRRIIQIFFFVLIALIAINKTLVEAGGGFALFSSASLHALCPFGGVTTIYQFFTTGTFVKKIHESSFILMIIGFILAVGFGPLFCGWVCPLGSAQEWFGKLGRKLFKKRYNHFIPPAIDNILRYLRYGVMVWVLYMVAITGEITIFQDIDPYFALFNFYTSEVAIGGVVVLLLTLSLSLFVERPWCKYACPYGAVLGITNLFRVFKIVRQKETCISCKACDRECPMNISVSESRVVRNHQCISCMKCTSEEVCPVKDTMIMGVPLKTLNANNKTSIKAGRE
jgi:polyferredoxin